MAASMAIRGCFRCPYSGSCAERCLHAWQSSIRDAKLRDSWALVSRHDAPGDKGISRPWRAEVYFFQDGTSGKNLPVFSIRRAERGSLKAGRDVHGKLLQRENLVNACVPLNRHVTAVRRDREIRDGVEVGDQRRGAGDAGIFYQDHV